MVRTWSAALLLPGLLAIGLLTAYAPAVLHGFGFAPGDQGDGRIMLFLLESSWRAWLGQGHWLSPPMFAPTRGVLGYTDAHLLWVPLYGALRSLGLAPVRALAAMLCALLAFGYLTCWLLLRRALGVGGAAAAVGAYLFAFSSALTLALLHGQMIGAMLLPTLCLLLHAAWRRGRWLPAAAAGLLTGLLAATSYIVAWFFLFIAGLAAVLAVLAWPGLRRAPGRPAALRLVAAFAAGLLPGLLPFAAIYAPQILHGPRRDFGDVAHFLPLPSDLLDLGAGHPVWGGVLAGLGLPQRVDDSIIERCFGATPVVWLLAAVGAWLLWRQRARLTVPRAALLAAAAAAGIATLLQFDWGFHPRPWGLVYRLVPGASAIRTPFRSQLDTMLPLAGLLAVALDRMLRSRLGWVGFALAALAVTSESAWSVAPYGLSAATEARFVAGAPPPPAGCGVFALAPQPGSARPWWMLQSDALMLALHWRLPTVNGQSSWTPPGWDLLRPESPAYAAGLKSWVAAHGLRGRICLYDVAGRRWLDSAAAGALLE